MKKVSKYSSLLLTIFIFCPGNIFAQPIWTKQNPYQMKNYDPPAMNKQPGGGYQYQHSPFTSDTVFEDNYPTWYSGFEPDPRISEGISPTWVREYGTPTDPSIEQFNAVVMDNTGNVYVGGQSEEPFPRYSIGILAKYDTNGNLQWLVKEKGVGSIDRVYVDVEGNLYAGGGDVMMKFDSQGVKQWSIDTCGSRTDVDPIGNVFSTSSHDLAPEGSIREIVTRKYDFDGHHQWSAYYSFKTGSVNDPTDIASDGSGGVVITGGGDLTGLSPGTITIKYASDGSEHWRVKYNAGTGGKVTMDKSGAVYLSVTSNEGKHYTIKYNISGTFQWATETIGNVRGISADESGNVVVALEDAGKWRTVKYDQSGVQKWQQIYDKPNYTEDPRGLTVDTHSNVYVAGTTTLDSTGKSKIEVLCYDQTGWNKWTFDSQDTTSCTYGNPLILDANGNVYIVGGKGIAGIWGQESDKAFLLKLRSAGIQQWSREYDTPGIYKDAVLGMGLDVQGNIYVCGTRIINDQNWWGRILGSHISLLKYNPSGNLLWKHFYEQELISRAIMKVGADGLLYLLYTKDLYDNDYNFYQNKVFLNNFDADGNLKWSVGYQPPSYVWLELKEILLDQTGDIYVILGRSGPDTTYATLLQKFSTSGNLVWSNELSGKQLAGNRCVVLDNTGNLYLTATEPNQPGSFLVLKYNASGVELWSKSYSSTQGFSCGPSSITTDGSGAVYVTGWYQSETIPSNILTIKFDQDGTQQWVTFFDGPDHGSDVGNDIGIDSEGNVFIGGTIDSSGSSSLTMVSYTAQGIQRWVQQTPGSWWGMSIDRYGEIQVIGNDGDIIYSEYSNDGTVLRSERYILPTIPDGPYSCIRQSTQGAIALDQYDHLYVNMWNVHWSCCGKGHCRPRVLASIITTLGYDLVPNSVESNPTLQLQSFTLQQNYPNPFNPSTVISYQLPVISEVELSIYNIIGQKVATLVNEKQNAGKHNVQFNGSGLASGVYFYQLRAGSYINTKKLLLLR